MAKESTEMRIEGEINPIARWQQEGYQRQNKVAHSIGGVAFNIGAAALTGFVPGCWTKPRPMHIAQTFASFGAAGAIITANYFDNTPHGKVVKWGMWGTDLTLTVVGLYTGRFSSGERVCKMLTVNRYPRDCRSSELDEGDDVQLVMFPTRTGSLYCGWETGGARPDLQRLDD